jgi:hypothetical protein
MLSRNLRYVDPLAVRRAARVNPVVALQSE